MKYKVIFLYLIFSVSDFAVAHGIYEAEKENVDKTRDFKQTHIFKEYDFKEYNPLFLDAKQKIELNYTTMLGLSNTQTLIFNGIKTQYKYPIKLHKMQLKLFGNMSFGNTLITTQIAQDDILYMGINAGFLSSMPLNMQDLKAHAVFGVDVGASFLGKQATSVLINSYFGIDFLSNQYVFRPFVKLAFIVPFSSLYDVYMLCNGSIGFKAFYHEDSMLLFASLALSTTFSKNNANIFILLPQSIPFYISANSLRFDFSAGVQYITTKYLNVNAALLVNYVANYYALNAGGQIGVSYRF